MLRKNRYFESGIIKFCHFVFLGFLSAIILSALTVDGWTLILLLLYGVPFSFICLLVLLLIAYGIKSYYDHSFVYIDKVFLKILIGIQIFLVIFNFGDCTSNSNQIDTNFAQRLLVTGFDCKDQSIKAWIPQEIILGIYALNLIILVIFILKTLASAHSKNPNLN